MIEAQKIGTGKKGSRKDIVGDRRRKYEERSLVIHTI